MAFAGLPDDGFKVPDEPIGREKYGEWTLTWSGWQTAISTSGNGYTFQKQAWWGAFREGDENIVVAFANGPSEIARQGQRFPEHEGLSIFEPTKRIAERANAYKAEAKARLLDLLDARPPLTAGLTESELAAS